MLHTLAVLELISDDEIAAAHEAIAQASDEYYTAQLAEMGIHTTPAPTASA